MQETDNFAYNNQDFLIIFAAGNSGTDGILPKPQRNLGSRLQSVQTRGIPFTLYPSIGLIVQSSSHLCPG